MAERGETLSEAQLAECKPLRQGKRARAFCPFHGSDQQRSLSIDLDTGRFQCFACQAWGYMDWSRDDFSKAQQAAKPRPRPAPRPAPPPVPSTLLELGQRWRDQLPGSPGADYLEDRKIPLQLAIRHGLGFAQPGQWPQRAAANRWPWGRLVAPHTNPQGEIVNFYSRAVGDAPKELRHDHLSGLKGYFDAPCLLSAKRVYVCEGVMDALSLLAAGAEAAIAIFGVQGWRMDWMGGGAEYVFAFDSDAAGRKSLAALARELTLRGKRVLYLNAGNLGGAKDVNEAWVAGCLEWNVS